MKKYLLSAICFFMCVGYVLLWANPALAGWGIQTVDSAGDVGAYTSIALDTNNYPHISYFDYTNGNLKYAKWTGSSWNIQTVDSASDVGACTSIALDTNNNPHISYCDWINCDLKYAKWTGSSWNIQTVDSAGDVGWDTSIALDTNNYPHISYCDSTNYDLKYAKWTGSSWNIQTVDSARDVGGDTSIALDTNNYPHISYCNGTNYDLKYAKWTNSPILSWTGESNYTSDGLHPETGTLATVFTYRVKYTDADNDAPKSGYPKIHIKKGGVEVSGSPFVMTYASGDYSTGAIYTYSTTLTPGTDYTYYFEAYDTWNAPAAGVAAIEKTGPVLATNIPDAGTMKVYHGVFKPGYDEKASIMVNVSEPGKITVKVYDSNNKEVAVLLDAYCEQGQKVIMWDGKDRSNGLLASGVYVIRVEGAGIKQMKKVVIVR